MSRAVLVTSWHPGNLKVNNASPGIAGDGYKLGHASILPLLIEHILLVIALASAVASRAKP